MEFYMPELIWPCWAYVLKRAGKIDDLSFDWMEETMPSMLKKFNPKSLIKGTVLVWQHKETKPQIMPVIIKNGTVIWKKCKYNFHAAVYEGDDLYSDVMPNRETTLPFVISLRSLSDTSTLPQFMIEGLLPVPIRIA